MTLPLAFWLLVPAAASASCTMPIPIEEAVRTAEVVITGTVTSTENDGRWAVVEVHEIWKGPDLPATVIVRGGPEPGTASSIDRSFTAGARYLFVASLDGQGGLSDNACSATTEMAAGDNALRPKDFRTPTPVEPSPAGIDIGALVAPVGVALLVAAALLAMGLLARGRQTS
jgi:hypothetical protein